MSDSASEEWVPALETALAAMEKSRDRYKRERDDARAEAERLRDHADRYHRDLGEMTRRALAAESALERRAHLSGLVTMEAALERIGQMAANPRSPALETCARIAGEVNKALTWEPRAEGEVLGDRIEDMGGPPIDNPGFEQSDRGWTPQRKDSDTPSRLGVDEV